jgi:hypothetical protein
MEMHAYFPELIPELVAERPLQQVSVSGSSLSGRFFKKTDSERQKTAVRNSTVGEKNLLFQTAERLSLLSAPEARCL